MLWRANPLVETSCLVRRRMDGWMDGWMEGVVLVDGAMLLHVLKWGFGEERACEKSGSVER